MWRKLFGNRRGPLLHRQKSISTRLPPVHRQRIPTIYLRRSFFFLPPDITRFLPRYFVLSCFVFPLSVKGDTPDDTVGTGCGAGGLGVLDGLSCGDGDCIYWTGKCGMPGNIVQCVALCSVVLCCVAVCCSVLQCAACWTGECGMPGNPLYSIQYQKTNL